MYWFQVKNAKFLENQFKDEIKSDINSAKTAQDILAVKNKIDTFSAYHQQLEQKGSYFDLMKDLQSLNIQLSRKANELGVQL